MISATGALMILGYAYFLVKTSDYGEVKKKDVEAINDILKEKKVKNFKDQYAYVCSRKEYSYYNEYEIQIPIGKTTDDLEKCISAIETYFRNDAKLEYRAKRVFFKVYTTELAKHYDFQPVKIDKDKGLTLFLGISREGAILEDLSINPHLSVVGSTGSGKSVFVNCILCNLIETYTENELELVLFDLKGNELNEYKNLKHTVYHTTDVEETIEYFDVLDYEMKDRYRKLGNHRDIKSYNKANPHDPMKYQFIVLEECVSLVKYQKHYNKLGELMSKGRACGMHFMLTTQRPSGDIIPKIAYTHVRIRVGLSTSSAQESINAIEMGGLEKINTVGRGIIKINGHFVGFQGSYISNDKILEITKKHAKTLEKEPIRTDESRSTKEPKKETVKTVNKKMFKFEEE